MSFLPTNILSVHMCMYVEYMSFVLTNITYFLFTIVNMCVIRDDGWWDARTVCTTTNGRVYSGTHITVPPGVHTSQLLYQGAAHYYYQCVIKIYHDRTRIGMNTHSTMNNCPISVIHLMEVLKYERNLSLSIYVSRISQNKIYDTLHMSVLSP